MTALFWSCWVTGLLIVVLVLTLMTVASRQDRLSLIAEDPTPAEPCPGPLVWFEICDIDANPTCALVECHTCGYVLATGNYHDEAHVSTPMMREGMAA